MKCSKCGRKAPPNKDTCLYCGGAVDTSFVDLQIDCPACAYEMEKRTVEGIVIDHCSHCNGVWLDKNELEQLAKKSVSAELIQPLREKTEQSGMKNTVHGYRKCPRCEQPMLFKNYNLSGAILDVCGYHGLFFDNGELSRAMTMVNRVASLSVEEKDKRKEKEKRISRGMSHHVYARRDTGLWSIFDMFWS